jgi:plasmid stabilization system protein ParE
VNEDGRVQTVGFADPKLLAAYHALESGTFEDRRLHAALAQAVKTLKENPEAGPKVPRPLWPRAYVRSYGIDNLRKLDLPDGWRLTYTLKGSRIEVMSVILEWMSHKQYEKRFGYQVR